MGFKGVDHIVVRVGDLEEAIANYSKILDIEPDRQHSDVLKADQAFYHFGDGTFLELITPTEDDSPLAGPLAKKGDGIHTVAFTVDDQKETAAKLEEKGVRVIGGTFVHPAEANGVMVQLSQSK
jgi:methylmalonyl-CoA epimerase